MNNKKPFDIEALTRILGVSISYDISPDGKEIALVWERSGHAEIWLVPTAGGEARQLTSGPQSKYGPRYSPDGRTLAYAQDYGGDENYDIMLINLATGQTRNLTPDTPDETINSDFSWSSDGRQLSFVSNREGQMATYIIEVESGAVRRATHHSYVDYGARFSPDGRWLAVDTHTFAQNSGIFVVPVDGGKPVWAVSDEAGVIDAMIPRWTPDSKQILFSSNRLGRYNGGLYDLESGQLTWLTESEWPEYVSAVSPNGRKCAYTLNRDGNVEMVILELETGETQTYAVGPGLHYMPRFSPDGSQLYFVHSGPGRPEDLWALDLGDARFRQLTQSLSPEFGPDDFVTPVMVQWPSDEWTVHGVLYRPERAPGDGLPPGIIHVHGGPTWQWSNEWAPFIQHLVSHGFVVLSVNYRGSTGYGKKYQTANRFDLGGGDMRDAIRGAEYLAREGLADPKRLGIMGTSYGGYLTVTALARYPKVFAAGSAFVPYLNWFTEHASEREDLQYWDLENFGDPEKDADRYREYSPIFFMENVVAPLQLIAGENDPRCPANEARQAAEALAKLGRPHELVVYSEEGHGFESIDKRVDANRRQAQFLLKYLGNGNK